MLSPYRKFVIFVKKNWFFYSFGGLGVLLTCISEAAIPKFMQWCIDLLVDGKGHVPAFFHGTTTQETLTSLCYSLFFFFVLCYLGGILWREGIVRMTHLSGKELRTKHWEKLRHVPFFSFLHKYTVGDLVSRLSQDYNYARIMHGFNIILTLDIVFFVVIVLALMCQIDPLLTFYCLLCFLLVPPFITRLAKKEYRLHLHAQQELSSLSDLIAQAITTVKLQRSTGSEPFWLRKLRNSAKEYANRNFQTQRIGWLLFPFAVFPVICSYVILFTFGIQKITAQQLSIGQFFALSSYVLVLQSSLYTLSECISSWQRGLASYERLLEISEQDPPPAANETTIDPDKPLLEIRAFSYQYDRNNPIINDMNLQLAQRKWLGISGALGKGKTTLLRCIAGLLPTEAERIFIYGTDVNQLSAAVRTKLISYVPQRVFLFSTTIRENLCLDQQLDDEQLWQVLETVQLQVFIASLPDKLNTKIGEWGVDLSGGQKQRLAIARAILRQPHLLLLDDCFSAIDTATERKIMHYVHERLAATALVWASHRPSSLQLCSKVITLG